MQKFAGFREAMLAAKAEMIVAEARHLKERTLDGWLFYCLSKIMLAQDVLCWYSVLIKSAVGVGNEVHG